MAENMLERLKATSATVRGPCFFPDGRKYVGDFLSGKRTGSDTMTYPAAASTPVNLRMVK